MKGLMTASRAAARAGRPTNRWAGLARSAVRIGEARLARSWRGVRRCDELRSRAGFDGDVPVVTHAVEQELDGVAGRARADGFVQRRGSRHGRAVDGDHQIGLERVWAGANTRD